MDLTSWTLRNRVIAGVLFTLFAVGGASAYGNLPRAEDPGFVIRQAIIITEYPGATAEKVEELVTDTIEEGLQELVGLDFIQSESRPGQSVITVAAEETLEDVQGFWDEMRERVAEQARELPPEAIGPFVNDDFGDVFGTVLTLTGDGFNMAELEDVAESVRKDLLTVPFVAKVQLHGVAARRVFVEYDDALLNELGVDARSLARQLSARNIVQASGRVLTEGRALELESAGNLQSLRELEDTLIRVGDESVPLSQIAKVRQGYEDDPPAPSVSYTGRPAIAVAVSMQPDGKITEMGPAIREAAEEIIADLPAGLELHVASYQTAVVDTAVDTFVGNLFQSVLIVLGVMLLFLGLRTGLIVGAMVPMTILSTLAIMSMLDIGIDKMSLTALIISLGLLVDNGVVIAESIQVRRDAGEDLAEAAISVGRELKLPLLIASLTTVGALLPTYLAESTVGEYTSPIAEVVGISLISSWILSVTFVPLCCVLLMRRKPQDDSSEPDAKKAKESYRELLSTILRWRWLALPGALVMLFAAGALFNYVPQQFFPGKDWPQLTVEVELPEGTPRRHTDAVVEDIERFLAESYLASDWDEQRASRKVAAVVPREERAGVVNWTAFSGAGAPRYVLGYAPQQPRENFAYFLVNAEDYELQEELIEGIDSYIRDRFPEAEARVLPLRNGPPLKYPVEIRIRGRDESALRRIVTQTEAKLREIKGLTRIGNDWGPALPSVQVAVDSTRLHAAKLTHEDVAETLDATFRGATLSRYRDGNDVVPIELRRKSAASARIDDVRDVKITGSGGAAAPLLQVAELETSFKAPVIRRRDRERTITVRADIAADAPRSITAFSVAEQMEGWLDARAETWPFGFGWMFGGEVESSGKANASIQAKQPVALLIIVLCLVFQFNTLREPLIVLLTLPFAIIGVSLGLFVTQKPFGFMALLGVIALFGIVINNAIVLLDRVQIEIAEGKSKGQAILDASQQRLRPILMTTATTVAGLFPLAVSGGPLFSPMAVALMSGLLVSTLLTLGLVPILYGIFHGVKVPSRAASSVLLFGSLVGSGVAHAQSPPKVLTADEAAQRAARQSIDAAAAETELQKAKSRDTQVVIGYLPRLTGEASYSRLSDLTQPGFPGGGAFPVLLNQTRFSAGLSVPLSSYVFELSSALRAADADRQSADANLDAARVRAAAQARLAYYDWTSSSLQLRVFEQRLTEATERLAVARSLFEAGRTPQTDYLRAQSALARAELQRSQAASMVERALQALRVVMVTESFEAYTLPKGLPPFTAVGPMPSLDAMFDEALEQRLEVRRLRMSLEANETAEALTRSRRYPVLEGYGNVLYANPNPRFIPNQERFDATWELGLRLSWSPNDLAAALAEEKSTEADTARVRAELDRLMQALRQEVVDARRGVLDAESNRVSARASLEAAEAAYRQQSLTYEEGASTMLDLLQTESDLVAAQLDDIRARIQARTARVRLNHALGRDVEPVLNAAIAKDGFAE